MVVGAVFALVAFKVYCAGVFLLTAFTVYGLVFGWFPESWMWAGILAGAAAGLLVGLLAMEFMRPMLIVSTALGGAWYAAQAFLPLVGLDRPYMLYPVCAVLTVVGIVVQCRTTRPRCGKTV